MDRDREERWGRLPVGYILHVLLVTGVSSAALLILSVLVNGIPSWNGSFLGGNFTEARVFAVSQIIVQFDSFSTAAWVAGFAFLWGLLVRESRAVEQEIFEFNRIVAGQSVKMKSADQKSAGQELIDVGNEFIKDIGRRRRSFFVSSLLPLTLFVASGLCAIVAILTGGAIYVWASLYWFINAIGLTLVSWYWLYEYSSHLSEQRNEKASWTRELQQATAGE